MADTIHGIAADAPVWLDDGDPRRITWGEFARDNSHGVDEGGIDLAEVAADLRAGRTHRDGGGASAEWSIRLVVGDEV